MRTLAMLFSFLSLFLCGMALGSKFSERQLNPNLADALDRVIARCESEKIQYQDQLEDLMTRINQHPSCKL